MSNQKSPWFYSIPISFGQRVLAAPATSFVADCWFN